MYYNVKDYIKDYKSHTEAIQKAIDEASDFGGGTVIVPAGEYHVVTIELKSNITLHMEQGSKIIASGNYGDYKNIGYYHTELGDVKSVLFALHSDNIVIEGEGTIELSGDSFYDFSKPRVPDQMRDKISEEQLKECTVYHENRVNQPIFFGFCQNVKIRDIFIQNSPCWTITFTECENIRVQDVTIQNSLIIPNNDGVHFCGCNGVIVQGCNITSGDDCIALSSITNWEKFCENITISDCILVSCSKAISIGYMHSMVRNVTINNVIINRSNRGISIMANNKLGLVENVTVSNCLIDTKVYAGDWWGNGEPIFIMATPHNHYGDMVVNRNLPVSVKNINLSNIICKSENVIGFVGVDQNIDSVTLWNIRLELKESKNKHLKGNVTDLSPSPQVETIPNDGKNYTMILRNVKNVSLHSFEGIDLEGNPGEIAIVDSANIVRV